MSTALSHSAQHLDRMTTSKLIYRTVKCVLTCDSPVDAALLRENCLRDKFSLGLRRITKHMGRSRFKALDSKVRGVGLCTSIEDSPDCYAVGPYSRKSPPDTIPRIG